MTDDILGQGSTSRHDEHANEAPQEVKQEKVPAYDSAI